MGVFAVPVVLIFIFLGRTLATATAYLAPGFQFNYDKPGQQLSIPVTGQCERIHLQWSREPNNTGPLPVAPYFFQVYTSTSETPYVVSAGLGPTFDWDVPFAPDTQYQICMFDSNGVSGGCQATYTVIANTTVADTTVANTTITNTTVTTPTCQNVTAPSELSVSGSVPLGLMSKYSYIDQCTSLSVTPKSGKPPFTLTVAPSFHPPYNLTSNTMDQISWLVSLPVGYRFFLAMSSSDGLLWANGPMQVGDSGPTGCLAPGTVSKKTALSIIIGTGVGGTTLGLALGILAYILFTRYRRQRQRSPSQNYFASQYFSSSEAYKAPSIAPSTVAPPSTVGPLRSFQPVSSSVPIPAPSISHSSQFTRPTSFSPSLPMSDSTPLFSTPASRPRELPQVPLEPLRPNGQSRSSRRRATMSEYSEAEHSITASSDDMPSPTQEHFPLDAKRRARPSPLSDDVVSDTPSSSNTAATLCRSPTYARHPPMGQSAYVIDETEVIDVPPEYGRHTADTTCTPSIISSGRIPSNRF